MIDDLPDRETCREWLKLTNNRCNAPAVGIIWGKLFPPGALGPRCEKHLSYHCSQLPVVEVFRLGWSVYDLRPVNALYE